MVKVIIELEIEGDEDDARYVVGELLERGILQDAIADHGCDASELSVIDASHFVAHNDDVRNIRLQVGNDTPIDTTLDQWIKDNADGVSAEAMAAICALKVGETFKGGGGATLVWTVTVTSMPKAKAA